MPPAESVAKVAVAAPSPRDAEEFLSAVARSKSLHFPWVTPPATQEAYLRYSDRAASSDFAAFLVRRIDSGALVGVVNLSHIIPEPLSTAFVGFYAVEPHVRLGFMSASLRLVVSHAFQVLGLHRLEANVQPGNAASLALVQKLGFRREGFSPRYLKIAGEWRDHERWALLEHEVIRAAATKAP